MKKWEKANYTAVVLAVSGSAIGDFTLILSAAACWLLALHWLNSPTPT